MNSTDTKHTVLNQHTLYWEWELPTSSQPLNFTSSLTISNNNSKIYMAVALGWDGMGSTSTCCPIFATIHLWPNCLPQQYKQRMSIIFYFTKSSVTIETSFTSKKKDNWNFCARIFTLKQQLYGDHQTMNQLDVTYTAHLHSHLTVWGTWSVPV
jgi:hypothetical protein